MTLTGLQQKFLLHCEVERQLSPQAIVSYRSDFDQFKESLRTHGRFGLARQDTVATFSVEAPNNFCRLRARKIKSRQRGPVSRVLSPGVSRGDGHFSRTPVARRLQRPYPRAPRGPRFT